MIKELFIKNCGEEAFASAFGEIYKEAAKECKDSGVFFLNEEYIISVNQRTNAYARILPHLIEEARHVSENENLKLYAMFLYKAMQKRELYKKNIKHFELPHGYRLFAFLCLIPYIKNTYEYLLEKGIDDDIISATVRQYEECVFIYEKRFDHLGMNKRYFDWLQHYVDCEILNINRLRFEIHTFSEPIYMLRNIKTGEDSLIIGEGEFNSAGLYSDTPPNPEFTFKTTFSETDTSFIAHRINGEGKADVNACVYSKEEYRTVIKQDDTVLSVHIPADGELTKEACRASYRRAKDIFAKFYPQLDVKGFVCYSWMMSPELKDHMRESSKVLEFASAYSRFPIHTEGEDVLNFVFYLKFKTYLDLPEDTSLQRSLKKLYINGGRLYEYGGIFAADKIE